MVLISAYKVLVFAPVLNYFSLLLKLLPLNLFDSFKNQVCEIMMQKYIDEDITDERMIVSSIREI